MIKGSEHPSLVAEALRFYFSNWSTQLFIYGLVFVLSLAVALIIDIGVDLSEDRVIAVTVIVTIGLLFVVPVAIAAFTHKPRQTERDELGPSVPGVRILIVDDEESIRFATKEFFQLHGYVVHTAGSREEAERLMRKTEYSIVLQDTADNTQDERGVVEAICFTRSLLPQTKIVVFSSLGGSEIEDAAELAGADAYIRRPKPFPIVARVLKDLLDELPRQSVVGSVIK
jgi:CheY-like chemotaxis protein